MPNESPPALTVDEALAIIRTDTRIGGVVGALMICDDRLRAQIGETRETIGMLQSMLDDQAQELHTLRVAVSDLTRTIAALRAPLLMEV
jgi:hypothetical protein